MADSANDKYKLPQTVNGPHKNAIGTPNAPIDRAPKDHNIEGCPNFEGSGIIELLGTEAPIACYHLNIG